MFVLVGLKGRPEPDTPFLAGRAPAADAVIDAAGEEKDPVRDADFPVSDSESRDNLPDNQNRARIPSAPTEEDPASGDGDQPTPESPVSGSSGHKATKSAPEAGTSK